MKTFLLVSGTLRPLRFVYKNAACQLSLTQQRYHFRLKSVLSLQQIKTKKQTIKTQ